VIVIGVELLGLFCRTSRPWTRKGSVEMELWCDVVVARVRSSRKARPLTAVKMKVSKRDKESIETENGNVNALDFSYTVCAVMTPWALARSMQFSSMCIPSIPTKSSDPLKRRPMLQKMRNGESRKIYQKSAVTSVHQTAFTPRTP
jgi:hypothetical protein